jgi:hypothetical protein
VKTYDKLLAVFQAKRVFPNLDNVRSKVLWLLPVLLCSPISLFYMLRSRKKLIIPYVELVATERCTLRCRACANLMQCYAKPRDYALADLRRELDTLLSRVSAIWVMQVLGGEPFIYPQLAEVLEELSKERKVKRIRLVTNGTVLPGEKVLKIMQNRKFIVLISDYGALSRKLDELISVLKKWGINYRHVEFGGGWLDYGGLEKRGFDDETLNRSYKACAASPCKTLLGGRIYACPRAAHMAALGMLPRDVNCVDISAEGDFARSYIDFCNQPALACDYCNPPWARPPIPAGEQVTRFKNYEVIK